MIVWYIMSRIAWPLLLLMAIYAIVRGIADLRAGRRIWGVVGVLLGLAVLGVFMMVPLETRALAPHISRN